jgi:hypothetical protein
VTVFSYLLFGQVIDNLKIHRQKLLFVVVEILMAFWFIITGWVSLLDLKLDDQNENPLSVVDKDYYSS